MKLMLNFSFGYANLIFRIFILADHLLETNIFYGQSDFEQCFNFLCLKIIIIINNNNNYNPEEGENMIMK